MQKWTGTLVQNGRENSGKNRVYFDWHSGISIKARRSTTFPFEVLFDDLGNVVGLDLAVPDTFGIDENGDADRAKSDRAAIRQTRSRPSDFGPLISFPWRRPFDFQYAFKLFFDLG